MQYLLGLAHGCWVVSHGWMDACLEAGAWVPEAHYEAKVRRGRGGRGLQLWRLIAAQLGLLLLGCIAGWSSQQAHWRHGLLKRGLLALAWALCCCVQGQADQRDTMLVPARARQRHASHGAGLFDGWSVCFWAPPASSSSRGGSAGSASNVAMAAQMVAAEGGTVARSLGGAGEAGRSPERGALLVCVVAKTDAAAAVKQAQVRQVAGCE